MKARTAFLLALVGASTVLAGCAGPATPPPTANTNQVTTRTAIRVRYDVDGRQVDAHDGTVVQDGSTYYLYGTAYDCGYTWGQPDTPWCGFKVYSSTDLHNWTFVRALFSPTARNDWRGNGDTWQATCGRTGAGCFNPRMIRRQSDGVWILTFNAPADSATYGTNAYYFMGCAGPAGPCGPNTGAHSSLNKPALSFCTGNGDHSLFVDDAGKPWMVCTDGDLSVGLEPLNAEYTNGTGSGGQKDVGGLKAWWGPSSFFHPRSSEPALTEGNLGVEAPGVVKVGDGADAGWVMTYSAWNCGYCDGGGTAWGFKVTDADGLSRFEEQGVLSRYSCGGQPRTTFRADGLAWQWIDDWVPETPASGPYKIGKRNQKDASIILMPLNMRNGRLEPFDLGGGERCPA